MRLNGPENVGQAIEPDHRVPTVLVREARNGGRSRILVVVVAVVGTGCFRFLTLKKEWQIFPHMSEKLLYLCEAMCSVSRKITVDGPAILLLMLICRWSRRRIDEFLKFQKRSMFDRFCIFWIGHILYASTLDFRLILSNWYTFGPLWRAPQTQPVRAKAKNSNFQNVAGEVSSVMGSLKNPSFLLVPPFNLDATCQPT